MLDALEGLLNRTVLRAGSTEPADQWAPKTYPLSLVIGRGLVE